jgi:large subunit ribosomal protein L30
MSSSEKKVRVTLKRSIHGQLLKHRNNVRGLGLKKINDVRELVATPEVMGMVNASAFMLQIEEV